MFLTPNPQWKLNNLNPSSRNSRESLLWLFALVLNSCCFSFIQFRKTRVTHCRPAIIINKKREKLRFICWYVIPQELESSSWIVILYRCIVEKKPWFLIIVTTVRFSALCFTIGWKRGTLRKLYIVTNPPIIESSFPFALITIVTLFIRAIC